VSVADVLSDAGASIGEYLAVGAFDSAFEAEIRRVLGEIDSLRERLDAASLAWVLRARPVK
jgi:hypothetical protein